jgi:ketosteroid isomerase-like protein
MTWIAFPVALFLLLGAGAASAQDADQAADHEALRKLKSDVVDAINSRNLEKVGTLLHRPFLSTVITQESFNDAGKLRAWFEDLFARRVLRVARIQMQAEADEASQIYTGTFAVARGSSKERYELADGRGFDIDGRWTATAIKENGQWTVLALHDGANFLDNPIINAIERNTLNIAAIGSAIGAIVGFLLGFVVSRWRGRPA